RDTHVQNDLAKLQSGDYLQGYGRLRSSYISVKSVDLVGLRAFIGSWQTDDQTIIRVANFRQMQIFLPSRTLPASYEPPVNVEYAITPQGGGFWTILLNALNDVQTGTVRLEDDQFTLIVHRSNEDDQEVLFRRIDDD
ncbi:MAG: hypothetical protein AAF202_06565, partial [Pseudomonadota bacterium]